MGELYWLVGVESTAARRANDGFRHRNADQLRIHLLDQGSDGMIAAMSVRDSGAPALDRVSKAIIEQLQQDGRRSYAAISSAVACPRPREVRQRSPD